MKSNEKIAFIKSICAEDCVKIEPNNNQRYSESEVYVFIKDLCMSFWGEQETISVYVKMYLDSRSSYDVVVVISFHLEGMYE